MRVVVAHAYGPPQSFALEQRPEPMPGPGEVRIRIQACGVSFVDGLIAAGRYQVQPPLPYTPGTEFSGVVDRVGAGVGRLAVGDRVAASALGGGFADQAILPDTAPWPIPMSMSHAEAAVFVVSFGTAYHALVQRGRIMSGETVLVLGGGGAVALAAIQLASALGARVIASASSPMRGDLALKAGASAAIQSDARDWRAQLDVLTKGQGVDIVVDPVGGAGSERAFRALGWNGRHLMIGFASGEIPRLPTNLPLLKGAEVVGVDIRQFGLRSPNLLAENTARLFDLYSKGRLHPVVAGRFPLPEFDRAMEMANSRAIAGRVVLDLT